MSDKAFGMSRKALFAFIDLLFLSVLAQKYHIKTKVGNAKSPFVDDGLYIRSLRLVAITRPSILGLQLHTSSHCTAAIVDARAGFYLRQIFIALNFLEA